MCSHEITKIWLGDSEDGLIMGAGCKYKEVTCNTAASVIHHAVKHVEKKLGLTIFNMARFPHNGFNVGYHGASLAAAGAVSSLPLVGLGAFAVSQLYLRTDFADSAEWFFDTMENKYRHLHIELKEGNVYYRKQNVCSYCKYYTKPFVYEYAGISDSLKCATKSFWKPLFS